MMISLSCQPSHGGAELLLVGYRFGNCHLPRLVLLPSLFLMRRLLQAAAACCVMGSALGATAGFTWSAPQVERSIFKRDLGMLDTEREEYATNLANLAGNTVTTSKASTAALADARRMLGLALQLSPRNKRALVLSFQLSKGVLPEIAESEYSASVFARLLLTRGHLLEKQGGADNALLARYFVQLAAELDPKNEDAVYASEVQRLDLGTVDWSLITDSAVTKPETAP